VVVFFTVRLVTVISVAEIDPPCIEVDVLVLPPEELTVRLVFNVALVAETLPLNLASAAAISPVNLALAAEIAPPVIVEVPPEEDLTVRVSLNVALAAVNVALGALISPAPIVVVASPDTTLILPESNLRLFFIITSPPLFM
jgi:hypothetical protein